MKVNVSEFLQKYASAEYKHGIYIPEDIFIECSNLAFRKPSGIIELPDNIIDVIEANKEKAESEDEKLAMCAMLNNEGAAHEKAGEISLAIRSYEKNIEGDCHPATYSFDRLMILYRRQKDYDNEIRIILKAIDVFTKENERRARQAIADNPNKASEIKNGLETCKPVYGNMRSSFTGSLFYCFSPYDVNKYKKRLEKAKLLKQKQVAK